MVVPSSARVAPKAVIVSVSERPPGSGSERGDAPTPPRPTFPRACRLTRPAEYAAVFSQRRVIRGRCLTLHLLARSDDTDCCRLGLVVGKKLLPTAVSRNRVKRLIRETFRLQRSTLIAGDYVFRLSARPSPRGVPLALEPLRSDLTMLLGRCRITATRPGTR